MRYTGTNRSIDEPGWHHHARPCSACSTSPAEGELLQALRSMPAPEPDAGFEARVLASVLRPAGEQRTPRFRPLKWPVAAAAAMLLGLSFTAAMLSGPPASPGLALADEQGRNLVARPVQILLDSPRQLQNATIRVSLPANAVLEGYRDRQTLQWQADIPAGANRLSLPLLVPGNGEAGVILIEVEHRGARKTLRLSIPSAVPSESVGSITTT